jgi:serine/threonine-protein kinase
MLQHSSARRLAPRPSRQRTKPVSKPFSRFKECSSDGYIGTTIGGHYHLTKILGKGGLGTVYLAADVRDGSEVAVKIINITPCKLTHEDIVERAEILAKVRHKNVVEIKESGIHDGEAYIVMERMKGTDLYDLLKDEAHLSWETTKDIAAQVCAGLHALHEKGIIHRDIKPSNIFLTEDGTAKIFDFDISRFIFLEQEDDEVKMTGYFYGTCHYASPEQATGKSDYDHRADIYSFGLVMYKMLSGLLPFTGEDPMAIMKMRLTTPPTPLTEMWDDVSQAVNDVVMRALEMNPDKRFQSMEEMRQAILAA